MRKEFTLNFAALISNIPSFATNNLKIEWNETTWKPFFLASRGWKLLVRGTRHGVARLARLNNRGEGGGGGLQPCMMNSVWSVDKAGRQGRAGRRQVRSRYERGWNASRKLASCSQVPASVRVGLFWWETARAARGWPYGGGKGSGSQDDKGTRNFLQ